MEGRNMEIKVRENPEVNQTYIIARDLILNKINAYLSTEGLNIGKDEYCYVKFVGNHLEIGRAKIVLEE